MRLSAGSCYEIDGANVRRVMNGQTEAVGIERWRERQADLWNESATIVNARRSLTVEEGQLWHAMWRELEAIKAAVALLESGHPGPPPSR